MPGIHDQGWSNMAFSKSIMLPRCFYIALQNQESGTLIMQRVYFVPARHFLDKIMVFYLLARVVCLLRLWWKKGLALRRLPSCLSSLNSNPQMSVCAPYRVGSLGCRVQSKKVFYPSRPSAGYKTTGLSNWSIPRVSHTVVGRLECSSF